MFLLICICLQILPLLPKHHIPVSLFFSLREKTFYRWFFCCLSDLSPWGGNLFATPDSLFVFSVTSVSFLLVQPYSYKHVQPRWISILIYICTYLFPGICFLASSISWRYRLNAACFDFSFYFLSLHKVLIRTSRCFAYVTSIYLPPNMTKLSLNCNVCVLCVTLCVSFCVLSRFFVCFYGVLLCDIVCVYGAIVCVVLCSSLNRFLKHRHETDVYTPFQTCIIVVPKGIPLWNPERLHLQEVLRTLRQNRYGNREKKRISIRLTDEEYQPFKELLEHTTLANPSFFAHWFSIVLVNCREAKANDGLQALSFSYEQNKNNLNQIAHRLNLDHNKGIISLHCMKGRSIPW